jgi:hypothetical protein
VLRMLEEFNIKIVAIELFSRWVGWVFGFPVDFTDEFLWLFVFFDVLVFASGEDLPCGKTGYESLVGIGSESVDVEFEVEVFAAFFGGDWWWAVDHEDSKTQAYEQILIPCSDIGLGGTHPCHALDREGHFNIS